MVTLSALMCQEEDRLVELLEVLTFWNITGIQHISTKVDWFIDWCTQTTLAALDLCCKNTEKPQKQPSEQKFNMSVKLWLWAVSGLRRLLSDIYNENS